MSRYRLELSPVLEEVQLRHCADARYVWNLCVEQESWWRPGRGKMPGFAERCRQLTEARAGNPWLAEGSVIVQQQAVRDHGQAMANFFAGTHRRPRWRKAGHDEGFRIVHLKQRDVRRLNRRRGEVKIPKAGWVRFRWSRAVPGNAKSFRVTRDRAGRWHIAFAAIPLPVDGPGTGEAVGIDRGIAVGAALSTGEMLRVPGLLARRLEDKAPGRVERVNPAFTSQRCSACGHVASESRESQALFRCIACAYTENADVNAAKNIAAGHAVTARGGLGVARPVNREPQRAPLAS
jgi:transposase